MWTYPVAIRLCSHAGNWRFEIFCQIMTRQALKKNLREKELFRSATRLLNGHLKGHVREAGRGDRRRFHANPWRSWITSWWSQRRSRWRWQQEHVSKVRSTRSFGHQIIGSTFHGFNGLQTEVWSKVIYCKWNLVDITRLENGAIT